MTRVVMAVVCGLLASLDARAEMPSSPSSPSSPSPSSPSPSSSSSSSSSPPSPAPSSPSPAPSSPSVALGARVGLNGAFLLLPMAGASAGLTGRFRVTETFSLEPHVDGVLDQFFLIGFMQGQLGLPLVASGTSEGVRHHLGLGPLVGHGSFVGHITDPKPLTLVGGEAVVGTARAIARSWDLRFQAPVWVRSPIDAASPFVGVVATLGVMYGL